MVKEVKVVTPLREARSVRIEEGVTLAPEEKGAVCAGISAPLVQWYVEENQVVKKGQAIAYLDPIDYQMNLQQAEAGLAALAAQLAGVEKSHARLRTMVDSGVAPRSQFDGLDAQYEALKKQIESTEMGIELARRMVSKSTVRAPFSGVITHRITPVGSFVNHAMPQAGNIALLEKIDRLKASLTVSEIFYDEIEPQGSISFFIPTLNKTVKTAIHSKGKSINELKQFSVIGLVDNAEQQLPAGVFALATIESKKKERIIVPPTAVKNTGARLGEVYSIEGERVVATTVATGFPFEDGIEIIGEVPERIVADVSAVRPGETVRVIEP